jgi:predicted Zn-dependent protease
MAAMLVLNAVPLTIVSSRLAVSYSIEVEEFRWIKFPLRVLIDMNQWSLPKYATDVHGTIDAWMKAIGNYSTTFNDTTLAEVNYIFYLSNVNITNNYDIFVTFTPDEMPPFSNTVGMTTYKWNSFTHEPISPIIINITTYSASASSSFIRNVVMHEFGHALGLGHASPQSTTDGPELMYYISPRNQVAYPSTLDVYGLTILYKGNFSQTVELPQNIPYIMLTSGQILPPPPPSTTTFLQNLVRYLPVALVLLLIILVFAYTRVRKRDEQKETEQQMLQPVESATEGTVRSDFPVFAS